MKRKTSPQSSKAKSTDLPHDFVKMVSEVFTNTFEKGLKRFEKLKPGKSSFDVSGKIYPDEILLAVGLVQENQMIATTAYASVDFDPKASAPNAQDLLNACVDGIASLYDHLFSEKHPDRLEQLAGDTLAELEDIPFEWTSYTVGKRKVFLLIDKANPILDRITDDWLEKNDPKHTERLKKEQAETEKLFVTGPKSKKPPSSGSLH